MLNVESFKGLERFGIVPLCATAHNVEDSIGCAAIGMDQR